MFFLGQEVSKTIFILNLNLAVRLVEFPQATIFFFYNVLGSFLTLDQEDKFQPQLFCSINGTFILELLTEFLKISKTYISE